MSKLRLCVEANGGQNLRMADKEIRGVSNTLHKQSRENAPAKYIISRLGEAPKLAGQSHTHVAGAGRW